MLQRMELKSPLTVRQTSVVPFENPQNGATVINHQNGEQIILTPTTDAASQVPIQQPRSFIDNPYNNRGVLRSNNYTSLQSQQQQQQPLLALPPPQQVVPTTTRNVYLNR